jgi:hypothetical protein
LKEEQNLHSLTYHLFIRRDIKTGKVGEENGQRVVNWCTLGICHFWENQYTVGSLKYILQKALLKYG